MILEELFLSLLQLSSCKAQRKSMGFSNSSASVNNATEYSDSCLVKSAAVVRAFSSRMFCSALSKSRYVRVNNGTSTYKDTVLSYTGIKLEFKFCAYSVRGKSNTARLFLKNNSNVPSLSQLQNCYCGIAINCHTINTVLSHYQY